MNYIRILILSIFIICTAGTTFAENNNEKTETKEKPSNLRAGQKTANELALGKLFDQYATTGGGWFINKQCSILDRDKSKEFEWYIANINIAMGKLTKNMNMLKTLQQSAMETAQSEKYKSCGKESHEIVIATFDMAKNLNLQLTKQPYVEGESDTKYLLDRYGVIMIGMKLNDRCNTISKDIADDVKNVYKKVTAQLSKKYPDEMSGIQKKVAANEQKMENIDCAKDAQNIVVSSLKELRALEKELEK